MEYLILQPEYILPEKILENIPDRAAGTDRLDPTGMDGRPNYAGPELAGAPGYQTPLKRPQYHRRDQTRRFRSLQ